MFTLPELPYSNKSLEPIISAMTLAIHHGKHHAGYVKTLNTLLAESPGTVGRLEHVIEQASDGHQHKLFNNAAQCWNHSFYWLSMCAEPQAPSGGLSQAISSDFGDMAGLRTAFIDAGKAHFGSGWVWLNTDKKGRLSVASTHDAQNPMADPGHVPLFTCDLWEHSYYLDYQNDRATYLSGWFDQLADWGFASQQYAAATTNGAAWSHPLPIHILPGS